MSPSSGTVVNSARSSTHLVMVMVIIVMMMMVMTMMMVMMMVMVMMTTFEMWQILLVIIRLNSVDDYKKI